MVRSKTQKRVPAECLLVASSGGHLLQLLQFKDGWRPGDRHWVSFRTSDALSLLSEEAVTWAHHPTNRNVRNFIRNVLLAFRTMRELRPRAVVTTGAGVAVPFCWVGRLFGARIVFVESYSRINGPSLTGRLVAPTATVVFAQWPETASKLRGARYEGPLF